MKVTDITVFFLAFVFIIPVLISNSIVIDLTILMLSVINLIILKRFKLKTILYFLMIIFLPLISVFITTILYTKSSLHDDKIIYIGFIKTTKYALDLSVFLIVRTFSLSFISFSYLVALEYEKFIISLMQIFKLPVNIGYSLLVTFNAFYELKEEYIRIKNAYLMRFGKRKNSLLLMFPMVVSAARYAYYAGLSLESRGLNKNKSFLTTVKWNYKDTTILILNILFVASIMVLKIIYSEMKFRLM